jgi:hypothetical protein
VPPAIAKRAASARVERYGISYPPSAWTADCAAAPQRLALRGRHRRTVLGRRHDRRDERPSARAEGRCVVLRLMGSRRDTERHHRRVAGIAVAKHSGIGIDPFVNGWRTRDEVACGPCSTGGGGALMSVSVASRSVQRRLLSITVNGSCA